MNFLKLLTFSVLIWLAACNAQIAPDIFLAQGIIAGEATEHSIILQSRLTATDTLVDGDVIGIGGIGRFEIAVDESFANSVFSDWLQADSTFDNILKYQFNTLQPGTVYYYRLHFGSKKRSVISSPPQSFRTNGGSISSEEYSLAVVTGMNYYHHYYGKYDSTTAYKEKDRALGFPGLKAILEKKPDYFVGTGDNLYFDHPSERDFQRAIKNGKTPHPGTFGGKEMTDERGMRIKYHQQFQQPRFRQLFSSLATYWEKDDHDYRLNDTDPYTDFPISHELGISNFLEQLPVVDPKLGGKTYRTRRINKDLQIWMVEGRDYRDANDKKPGPDKTLWGKEQLNWLKQTLLESDATFKILISPTPMVGPDDANKKDNHVNPLGFRDEGEAFFDWIVENGFLDKNFYIVCGDRHWQYHARHPKGIEEFACGALVDNNSRAGRLAGDPESTDPEALVEQFYVQGTPEQSTGGFLLVSNKTVNPAELHFDFYDDMGSLLYKHIKKANSVR